MWPAVCAVRTRQLLGTSTNESNSASTLYPKRTLRCVFQLFEYAEWRGCRAATEFHLKGRQFQGYLAILPSGTLTSTSHRRGGTPGLRKELKLTTGKLAPLSAGANVKRQLIFSGIRGTSRICDCISTLGTGHWSTIVGLYPAPLKIRTAISEPSSIRGVFRLPTRQGRSSSLHCVQFSQTCTNHFARGLAPVLSIPRKSVEMRTLWQPQPKLTSVWDSANYSACIFRIYPSQFSRSFSIIGGTSEAWQSILRTKLQLTCRHRGLTQTIANALRPPTITFIGLYEDISVSPYFVLIQTPDPQSGSWTAASIAASLTLLSWTCTARAELLSTLYRGNASGISKSCAPFAGSGDFCSIPVDRAYVWLFGTVTLTHRWDFVHPFSRGVTPYLPPSMGFPRRTFAPKEVFCFGHVAAMACICGLGHVSPRGWSGSFFWQSRMRWGPSQMWHHFWKFILRPVT